MPTMNGLLLLAWLPIAVVSADGANLDSSRVNLGASASALAPAAITLVELPQALACGTNVMQKATAATTMRVAD